MSMVDHMRMMAAYNAWANTRLYDSAGRLPDRDYRADRGAFFGSVHGTLNHLLATDRIWLQRFSGTGSVPARLDAILCDTFAELSAARRDEDRRLSDFIHGLDDEALSRPIRYRRVSTPEMFEQPLSPALAHLFNHQTHHRGQVHAILTGLGTRAPELDLLVYLRQSGLGGDVVQSVDRSSHLGVGREGPA